MNGLTFLKNSLIYLILFIIFLSVLDLVLINHNFRTIHLTDIWFSKNNSEQSQENKLIFDSGDKVTVVILTYRRISLLLKLMKHYRMIDVFQEMLIVWNDVDNAPPNEVYAEINSTNRTVPVRLLIQQENNGLNKMRIYPEVKTQGVLLLDDDVYIDKNDIVFGYNMWKVFPDRLIGYVARRHVKTVSKVNGSSIINWAYGFTTKEKNYSLLLTGAVFIHLHYLKMFVNDSPDIIKVVEETKNCDDIAVNFVVANYLNKPVGFLIGSRSFKFLNVPKKEKNAAVPLSFRGNHYSVRTKCIQKFAKIYQRMPLIYFQGKLLPF